LYCAISTPIQKFSWSSGWYYSRELGSS